MGNEHGKIKHVGLERFNRVWDRACGEQGDDSLEVVQVIKVLGKVVPSLSKEEAMTVPFSLLLFHFCSFASI